MANTGGAADDMGCMAPTTFAAQSTGRWIFPRALVWLTRRFRDRLRYCSSKTIRIRPIWSNSAWRRSRTANTVSSGLPIKILSKPGIDIILLDLGLPELDGYKSHTAISRSAPHILIVILTTDERPVSRELTLSAGAADYLVKGEVSDYELRRAIRVAFLRPRKSGVSSSAWYT
jgi:CheY-like chemotaxis protein